jgi:subtilisin family serine protease
MNASLVPPPKYYWLWHLAALNVVQADFGPAPAVPPALPHSALRPASAPVIASTQWDRIAAATGSGAVAVAALIDTGVSRTHPNLKGRIDTNRSLDLTSHRFGARTLAPDAACGPATREQAQAHFAGLNLSGLPPLQLDPEDLQFFEDMVAEYRTSTGVLRRLIEAEDTFAAHGTACAGLMVGEPAAVAAPGETAAVDPGILFSGGAINPDTNLLPYFGVDPFSRLISIRTSFEADAMQFIAAFLYAWSCQVDVIVLPRGLPDPGRSRLAPKEELKADLELWENRMAADLFERLQTGKPAPGTTLPDPQAAQQGYRPDRAWRILRNLIVAISQRIPVVCAAGNDGESQLIYPANLASDDNGIIAVGAVTPEGLRSGYSNYGDGLTLVAPSDDFEVYNRNQSRLDLSDPLMAMHDYTVSAGTPYPYCPLDLVTTDLPGVFGYDPGTGPWASVLPGQGNPGIGGGYYTAFGGTSGASCLIGGLALLAQRARRGAGRAPLDGVALKQALVAACRPDAVVAPGYRPLTPDSMNGRSEVHHGQAYFFGAGLPDAVRLIDAMLPRPI